MSFAKQFTTRILTKSRQLNAFRALTAGAITIGFAGAGYVTVQHFEKLKNTFYNFPQTALCANVNSPQPNVISGTKNHALYLTIHLKPNAKPSEIVKTLSQLNDMVDKICPPDLRDEDDEILAGIGFGPNFLRRINSDAFSKGVENFTYEHRKGGAGNFPSTGGDIFIHAKCHERGKLFELCQAVIHALPANSIEKFDDIYGWVYRGGRDLSGFIDGTENPVDETERKDAAINLKTGGSYNITQRWVHKHDVIRTTKDGEMEKWIGRKRSDSTALNPKAPQSHVARTTGALDGTFTKYEIVRQSQPYGTVSGESGLFFIAYSKSPEVFNWMLDQMAGSTKDGLYDHVFHLTDCVTGSYFYFPSQNELIEIYKLFGINKYKGFW